MAKAKQFTFHLPNHPGTLGATCSALGKSKVNILALTSSGAGDDSVVRLVVDKPTAARKAFAAQGISTEENDVLLLVLPNKPGALGAMASQFGSAGVNIHHCYATTLKGGKAQVVFDVSDLKAAQKAARR